VSGDFVLRGKELLVRREFGQVVEVCRAGLLTAPDRFDGRLLLGTALLALRRYDEAVSEMRIAVTQEPTSVIAHLLRGEALLRRGDHQLAIDALAEAHALDPKNRVAAKLYNEALERAHPGEDDSSPVELAEQISSPITQAPDQALGSDPDAGSTWVGRATGPAPAVGRATGPASAGRATGPSSTATGTGPPGSQPLPPGPPLPLSVPSSPSVPPPSAPALTLSSPSGAPLTPSPPSSPSLGLATPPTPALTLSTPAGPVPLAARSASALAVSATPVARASAPLPALASDGAAAPQSSPPAKPRRRRRWPWIAGAAAAVTLLAGGAGTLAYLRATRQAETTRGERAEAERTAAAQTYRGYLRASEQYDVLARGGDDGARAAAARLRAAAVYEFRATPGATAAPPLAAGTRLPAGRDAELANVYQLLVGADATAAQRAAEAAAARYPEDAEAAYLLARAAARLHSPGVMQALQSSIALSPTPLAWSALGELLAAAGRIDDALHAFDAALGLVPGHPTALIARARALAASGRVPAAGGDELERGLARLADPGSDPEPLVSLAQAHLAGLALAEVKLARGDAVGATTLLSNLVPTEPHDERFGAALVDALLASGDAAGAQAEAEKWRAAEPELAAVHVWLARTALARDQVDTARAELEQAGDARESPAGLVVLGDLELAAGHVDAAVAALDRALAARASDRDAQVLRARADLVRGDAAAAEARLAHLYELGHDPVVGVILGQSLAARDARAPAHAVLEESLGKLDTAGTRPRLVIAGTLALARLARAEGRWADAQKAVARALALDAHDVDAALVQAALQADVGDPLGARTALDTLAVAAHADARVLVAAANAHATTGDAAGARPLYDEAVRLGGAPRVELAEVSARLALADGKPDEALAALRAVSAAGDGATLLTIDALVAAGKLDEASALAGELAQRSAGRAEEMLGTGRVQLARANAAAAAGSFTAALQRLEAAAGSAAELSDARIWLGRALEQSGRVDDALASYREAVRLVPGAGPGAVQLGRALVARGDAAGGESVLAQALKLDPALADAYFWLAQADRALGKHHEARPALRAYLERAPRGAQATQAQKQLDEP
jgi:tetratricopeptide (TPR) repeat protein